MARLSHGSALAWCLFGVALFAACGKDSPVEPDTVVDDVDPITRAEAITAARSAYLDDIAAANFTVASMGMTALPAGTHIQINHGDDHPVIETVLESESYFALVDRIPAADLPHPFTYLFIDTETGQVTTDEAFYPPLINGVPTYTTYEERTDPAHRFAPEDLDGPHPPDLGWIFQFEADAGGASRGENTTVSAPSVPLAAPARQDLEGGERLVISINGGRDAHFENTVTAFDEAMEAAGFDTETLESEDYTVAALEQRIRELTADLGPGDKVTLFIKMHARIDDVDHDGLLESVSTRFSYDMGGDNASSWNVFSTNSGLPALLSDIPAEFVNVIIETCGAGGGMIQYMQDPRGGGTRFEPADGSRVTVFSGSAGDRSCYNSSNNPYKPGVTMGLYTSVVLDYLSDHPLDADGNGTLSIPEIENGFGSAHNHATQVFSGGEVFSFDQKPPPATTFLAPLQIDQPSDGAVFKLGEPIGFLGHGWDPVTGPLTGTTLAWESDIDGSLGMGPSVTASDLSAGTHTIFLTGTYTNGDPLTRSVTITVGIGGGPVVTLTSPASGTTFRRGVDVEFAGTATDPEDGVLGTFDILWKSDIDGDIGIGTDFVRSDLSEGEHTITMEATDSDGNTVRATTQITMLNGVPEANIADPADGIEVTEGHLLSFVGSALDPEDGSLSGSALEWTSSLDGNIGTGGNFVKSDLSVGVHTITLTATDMNGNSDTDQITVTVNAVDVDLQIGGVVFEEDEVLAGGGFDLDVTVLNAGTSDVGTGWDIDVYLSADQTLDDADVLVGSAVGPALSDGESQTVSVSGEVPLGTAPGDYWWLVQLDPANEVAESNETNNESPSDDQVEVKQASLIEVSPVSLTGSHFVGVSMCPDPIGTLTITNPGSASVTVDLAWSLGLEVTFSSDQVTIPPGGTAQVDVEFSCSTTTSFTGTVSLTAQAGAEVQTVDVPVTLDILHEGLVLANVTGPIAAGTFITLDRISFNNISGPDNCASDHIHGIIYIDELGPYVDPDPPGCGHGAVSFQVP